MTKRNKVLKFLKNNNIVLILTLMIVAAVTVASPAIAGTKANTFIKSTNIFNLSQSIGTYGILAMGLTFVFLVGGIDLSIGYQVAFDGTIFAMLSLSMGVWPAMAITLVLGTAIGYLNGTIVTRMKITPLIGTLAVMTVLKGFVLIMNTDNISLSGVTVGGTALTTIYNTKLFGFLAPSVLIALIMILAFAFFLKKTRAGVNLYIVGGNIEAGNLSGVNPPKLTRLAYSVGGFCAAVCAVLSVFRMNAATYNMGDNIDITAICAVVVGGIKMQGGKGNMAMCIMGVAVIQIINNVMTKLGLHSSIQALVTGVVVILVLVIDKFTGKKEA